MDLGLAVLARSAPDLCEMSAGGVPLGASLVDRLDNGGRVDARADRRLEPPQRASASASRRRAASSSASPTGSPCDATSAPTVASRLPGANTDPIHSLIRAVITFSRTFTVRGWSASAADPDTRVRARHL